MHKFSKIMINSYVNLDLSKTWDASVISKLEISSIIDDKININFDEDAVKNKMPFIAQREAAWIRLHFRDRTYYDFVSDEILVLASENGVLINLLGYCQQFNTKIIVDKILDYIKNRNIKTINANVEFEYRKYASKNIKRKLKWLINQKNNILTNKFKYYQQRNQILREAIELLVQKRHTENNWDTINKILIKEFRK